MKPVCEVMVSDILPGVRAMIARKLVEDYGLSQKDAAEKLGTTQPAISQYKRQLRGHKIDLIDNNPRILEMISSIAKRTASGELSQDHISIEFCTVCKFMKSSGIVCEIHKKMYPSLENCKICLEK
jgi:predicted transcriptional regulator